MTTPNSWLSGHVLVCHWGIKDSELYHYLRKGLQAYTSNGIPVINPDVLPKKKKSLEQIVLSIRAEITHNENLANSETPGPAREIHPYTHPTEDEIQEWAKRKFETQTRTPVYPRTPHVINPFKTYTDRRKMRDAMNEALNYIFDIGEVNTFANVNGLPTVTQETSIAGAIKKERRVPAARATPRKLTPCQRHKMACAALAKVLWKENPDMTIPELQARDEILKACDGKRYHRKTFQRWVTKFNPNREPGGRRKHVTS